MIKKKKKWFVGCSLAVCIGTVLLIVGGWLLLDPNSPLNRRSALDTTQEWARLEPFPQTAEEVSIETAGSPFTREFIVTFQAPTQDIEAWLKKSPGTKDVTPTLGQDGSFHYAITPGGGAAFAEVTVSKNRQSVRIRTFWS